MENSIKNRDTYITVGHSDNYRVSLNIKLNKLEF